ncbi:D-glycerate dehydrogenase [Conexibacter sp. DBS9H8]|uniref:2-hydroxyacid dehydrogenase n=1 Tax=Conexibacter sp. DBS9H8 TaxID=2937801 RepID=UPI00200C87FE|nr:D-glycerate dehydrogenase [Conexibacter sp. DBS9H8]
MARVCVTRALPGAALSRLAAAHELAVWPGAQPPSPAELRAHATGATALITLVADRVDEDLLSALPDLRIVANYAVGYDNIDLAAAARHGVSVTHTPDVLTDATADLTWALLLAAARRLIPAADHARERWPAWQPDGFLGVSVTGATLGVIGAGRIGSAVARRAAGFDMTVLSCGRDHAGLGELLARSDFVSLHCPLTPATRHLINAGTLAQMPSRAILINTARGGIVDQRALAAALAGGQIAGAALDVCDPEPLPAEDPLWQAPNLLITPHIGSATVTARTQMAEIAVTNVLAALAGEPVPNPVPHPNAVSR